MHAEYPCCNKAEEDIHHILNCEERSQETEGILMRESRKSYKDIKHQDHILIQILEFARNDLKKSISFRNVFYFLIKIPEVQPLMN